MEAAPLRPDSDRPPPEIAVLVPVTLAPIPLGELHREVSTAFDAEGLSHEVIFVVDVADRESIEALEALNASGSNVQIVLSRHETPEAALPAIASARVRSPVVVTLPSYPRIDAEGFPKLVRALDESADLVCAVRTAETESIANRMQRRAFHYVLRTVVGGRFTDIACGVRAFRREVFDDLNVFGDSFRFVPLFALRDGFRVKEIELPAHGLDSKARVYDPGIYLRRLIDVIGLMFVIRFTYKPLRFFGLVGSAMAGAGGVIMLTLLFQRLGGQGIADRPLLLLGVLFFVMGVQSLALGLIGEIVVHHSLSSRPLYRVLDGNRPIDSTPSEVGQSGTVGRRG